MTIPGRMMAVMVTIGATLAGGGAGTGVDGSRTDGPTYASPETREVVEAMVAAHGGLEAWRSAPSVRYTNIFFNPFAGEDGSPWWIAHETIEQAGERRVYQEWPLNQATMAWDGERVWARDWGVGNPPSFQTYFFYYFTQLPWLTQDDGVRLEFIGSESLPGDEVEYAVVRMTFEEAPGVGKAAEDAYELFIHPETHLLSGYRYWVAWEPMLRLMGVPEGEIFGPMLRVHDSFATVDGLTVPTAMHTMPPDGSRTVGYHAVVDYSFSQPFDEERVRMPEGAQVDPRAGTP